MGKYGFSTAIPYGTDIFEVTGTEFCEWEDALEKANSEPNAMEWATYDVLINNGYFVSQPKNPRPTEAEKEKAKEDKEERDRNPGIRDGLNLISGNTREPVWTQSRILTERDKLVKEKERILELKQAAFDRKLSKARAGAIYDKDGRPFTRVDYGYAIFGVLVIGGLLVSVIMGLILFLAIKH